MKSPKDTIIEKYEGCDEMVDSGDVYDARNDDAWDASLDEYESRDDNGLLSNLSLNNEV